MARLAAGDHARHESDHAIDNAAQIDADQPVEIAIGGQFHRAEAVDARRVEQQRGGLAKHLLHLVGGTGIGGAVGDIEHDAMGSNALGFQRGNGLFNRIGAHVGNDDAGARAAKHLRLPKPSARCATRDEGQLALKVLHPRPFRLCRP